MKVVSHPQDIQGLSSELRQQGKTIALVPTMGWFHEGHLSLMRMAKEKADHVIATLFINPTQFGPKEDLKNYPYDLQRDSLLAEEAGVDTLYAPKKSSMYPSNFSANVHVKGLTTMLCGASRPGHFDGVTTVLTKIFNQTSPHIAIFGEKDFQQLAVIRRMVTDLNFPIEVIGHPIVREKNGLAMSSRNSLLREDEMQAALSLSQSIQKAKELTVTRTDSLSIIAESKRQIIKHPECCIDYLEIVNGSTLKRCSIVDVNSYILLAVKINNRVRLIDNSKLLEN